MSFSPSSPSSRSKISVRVLVCAALAATAVACGAQGDAGDEPQTPDAGTQPSSADAATGSDARADARVDAGRDAQGTPDAGGDATVDPRSDAGGDAAGDTGVVADAGAEAAADGGADAVADAGVDATTDGGADAASDAGEDASADAAADAAPDALADAQLDAPDDAPHTCVPASPAVETCNGRDDDCNGTVDDGCPSGVTLTATSSASPLRGNPTGGTAFDDACPAGEVLIGLSSLVNGYLTQMQGICGAATVAADTSTTPYTYRVEIARSSYLPRHGVLNGTAQAVTCAPGEAVVQFEGRGGGLVDRVTLGCAPLGVTGAPGSFALARGNVTVAGSVGGTGGQAFALFECPTGTVVARVSGRAGDGIDAIAMGCSTPALTLR